MPETPILERNRRPDGKGKYALLRLDKLKQLQEEADTCQGRESFNQLEHMLEYLHGLGLLEYGEKGSDDEFFVLKLKDKASGMALAGYSSYLSMEVARLLHKDRPRAEKMTQLIDELEAMVHRAIQLPNRKLPID